MFRRALMATNLPHLDEVTRLSPRVIRILGGNPSKFTLQGTNTYLIGTGRQRILIDTGSGEPSWPLALRRTLATENATISTCLLTHWHPDHISGVSDLLEICPDARVHKNQPSVHGDAAWTDIEHGQRFYAPPSTSSSLGEKEKEENENQKEEEGKTQLTALYCPGHATDHTAFILAEESAMFTGDNVLGHGTAVFEDLALYLQSLAAMKTAEGFQGRAYPAHGDLIEDGRGKIGEYIEHRAERERQVVRAMMTEREKVWTAMGVVKVVYRDVREELHAPAEGGVKLMLRKMEGEGKVESSGEGWRLVG